MSIRSFVTLCSVLLMAWLMLAFVYTPAVRVGADPVPAESEDIGTAEVEVVDDLAVSVSP